MEKLNFCNKHTNMYCNSVTIYSCLSISSIFDYITFAVLLFVLHAGVDEFRTGWLIESVVSASLIVLVIRTKEAVYKSKPGKFLLLSTFSIATITIFLPYSPIGSLMGLVPLPARFFLWMGGILVMYIVTAELAKRLFYRYVKTG